MVGVGGPLPEVGGVVPEVPGYRIERQLGRGSMGVVYLAEDVQLRRKVALKILSPTLSDDELFRKRFDRESQSAAKLDHPSIVPVYAAGEAGGLLYIAMRYVGGGDVRALLDAGGPLSLAQASAMVTSVADALDAAHAVGIVHRDVKPANILVDSRNDQEHFYLSDFGITKIISAGASLTSAGQIIGTIDYIAPEQIQGKAVDGRSDLYALGCVLYECLTAQVPFPRDETAAAMWAHINDETPSVTARRRDLPAAIDQIVAKAMAKQPEDRYATCRELAIALRSVTAGPAAAGEAGPVAPASPTDRPPPAVPAGMTSTYTPPTPPPARAPTPSPAPRWRWWWIVAASVVTLALLGGGTAGVMKYLSSRFPTTAEQALLNQVPLALQSGCTRNSEAAADTANVQASLTCTSNGDAPSTTVFTQFTSPQALDSHYRKAVGTSGTVPNSGDCLNTERAESEYKNKSDGTSGRTVCYQQRGSSFVAWTDSQSYTLAVATRVDQDYLKLRDWWAGVVGQPTKAQLEAEAKANQAVEEANKKIADERKRADEAQKREAETKAQKAADDAKRAEEDKKKAEEDKRKAEQQAREEDKKKAEDDKKKAEEDRKKAEEDRKKAEEDRKKAEEDRKKAEELKQQSPGSSQLSPQNLDGDRRREGPTVQQPQSNLGATPNTPTETGPQSPGAPTQLSTSSVTLSGPAPAAPGPQAQERQAQERQAQGPQAPERQQGGSAIAGSGGCAPTNAGYHLCALVPPAPGYLPGTTTSSTVLNDDKSAFVCQSDGSAYSVGNRTNHWWAWVGSGNLGVWVPTVFLAGATDNAPAAGLPVCSAGAPNATGEEPSTQGPSIIIEVPSPQPRDNTKDDEPPTFTFPF